MEPRRHSMGTFLLAGLLCLAAVISCSEDQITPPNTDTQGPSVTAIVPADASTSVAPSSSVTVTFSEPVKPSSVNDTTFQVSGASGDIAVSGVTATFTPVTGFTRATTYTVTVTQGITDFAGNALTAAFAATFTTKSSNALWVSPTGDDNNPDNPYASIQAAIDAANPGDDINVMDGTYNLSQTIVLKKKVSLFGGFDSASYNEDSLTTARDPSQFPTVINGAATALSGNLADSLTIDGLTIASAPGASSGESSIAISLHDCRDVVIQGNVITAGDGATGANGNSPARPTKANAGGDASVGSNQDGAPGGSAAGYGGYNGGGGGNGGTGLNEDGQTGNPGGGPDGGNGGPKGVGTGPANSEDGHTGGNGGLPNPRRVDYGTGGESFGLAENGTYTPSDGAPGTRGLPGSGGGGGGGGAASVIGVNGGGGGGGGAGGRQGPAGGGGGGGGASIGILITGPSRVEVRNNVITTGKGGDGGNGGTGGQGGAGGNGGPGVNVIGDGGGGGNGGAGGPGQNGGHGGGGGGGPSIGIVAGSFVAMTRSDNTITPGAGGAGGGAAPANAHSDGSAAGNPGAAGQSGATKER